jgi:hypothetical protein
MKLLIEALIHMYMTFKTTYYETRDPWDQKMMYDYRDILRKVEDLTGLQYVPTSDSNVEAAFETLMSGMPKREPKREPEELPDNILDFTKRRKDD